ncbi:uncharacterized protein NPIL_132451 [Nephila pilipes]|uniref:Uncharacterized protein n=1 Tax=Nephila pilipes TaxID=299642 RepID=A0A8X6MHM8_NEPPI|nr:uncharacterized protein NPIL_132451 [Nephila pilipes]
MSLLFKNKALAYIVRFFRRLIEIITRFVLFLKYCGRAKKLADIEDPILLESACSLAAKIRKGEGQAYSNKLHTLKELQWNTEYAISVIPDAELLRVSQS